MEGFQPSATNLLGANLKFLDAYSFVTCYNEIFINKNYLFHTTSLNPLILDCGANIGLSIIYFKKLIPDCRIIAFEPDPNIFQVLESNVDSFALKDVALYQKAVWTENTEVDFVLEGGLSSKILKVPDENKVTKVETCRLVDYLDQKVDFLKIDVEGVETDLLKSCEGKLSNVDTLFVEYHSYSREKQSLHEILAILFNQGFRYQIKEAFVPQFPYIEGRALIENRIFDIQLDIFAYRI